MAHELQQERPIAAAIAARRRMLLVLAGCMVLPGRFVSDLAVRKDGTFSFRYKGEIVLGALAQRDKMGLIPSGNEEILPPKPFEAAALHQSR